MLNQLGMGFIFTARDLATGKIRQLERNFTSLDARTAAGTARMTANFHALTIGLGIMAAGAATLAGAFALAGAAGRFEQGIAAVGAVTRATAAELEMLRDAAIEAGIRTQFSPDEAVAGLTSLATAGQTAEQATRTLIPVLDLAAGSLGQLGVAEAAEAVVGTLNAYGMQAEEAAGVTDRLLRVTQISNFQARDFAIGLSKAAAAGATFNQALDDVLITMGLLRNRNIDASSSATAFREAVRRVGSDQRAQTAVTGLGIKIFDESTGKMRSMVDVMTEFTEKTRDITDEERNRRVVVAFGARGLLAFNAVMNAMITRTLPDGTRETLLGAEAIKYMRQQMGGATGTAEAFKEKLLDTFQGQRTLLRGTLQTFAVVLGEPFAKVFKPIVGAVTDALNWLLRAFKSMPEPVKRVLAWFVVAAGAVTTLIGAVIAAKATIVLLAMGLKALGITLGGVLSVMLPAIIILGALAAAVAGFVVALRRNVGGIGDFFRGVMDKIKLFFRGLVQIFSEEGFSGAVREELDRAENQGLKRFIVNLYAIVHRLKRVWEGFKEGFKAAIDAAAPVFRDFMDSLHELGGEVGGVFGGITESAAAMPSEKFAKFGAAVGGAIATVVKWFVKLWAIGNRVVSGVIGAWKSMMEYIGPAFEVLREALSDLAATWRKLWGTQKSATDATDESTASWRKLGVVIGKIVGGAVTFIILVISGLVKVIEAVVWAVTRLKEGFVAAGTWIGETAAKIFLFFIETLPRAIGTVWSWIKGVFMAIGGFFVRTGEWFRKIWSWIGEGIMSFMRPIVDFVKGIADTIRNAVSAILDFVIKMLRKIPDALLPESLEKLKRAPLSAEIRDKRTEPAMVRTEETRLAAAAASGVVPAAVEAGVRGGQMAQLEAAISRMAGEAAKSKAGQPPFVVNVQVDGETIAKATHKATQEAADRSFAGPVPAMAMP